MSKSIHERVRAQIEKRERDAKAAADGISDARMKRECDREELRDAALDSLYDEFGFDEDFRPSEATIRARMTAMRKAGKGNPL